MHIIKANYKIITPISAGGIEELKQIERAGRVAYKSEDRITEDGESAKKFINMLIKRGHESVLEHSILSIQFTVSRQITHELVRSRLASFTQESTRFVNYSIDRNGGQINVINPVYSMKIKGYDPNKLSDLYIEWTRAMNDAEKHYMKMMELGADAQIAANVLPNSTKADITMTANYREWRHFFELRTANDVHPGMLEVTRPLLRELKEKLPVIFDDINYE